MIDRDSFVAAFDTVKGPQDLREYNGFISYDAAQPVLCFDERPCQLLGETVEPLKMKPGQVYEESSTYTCEGTCVLLAAIEPLSGRRIARVRRQRTKGAPVLASAHSHDGTTRTGGDGAHRTT